MQLQVSSPIPEGIKHSLLKKSEVNRRYGNLPDSTFYRLISEGKIPAPVKIPGCRSAFWVEAEIDEAISRIVGGPGREVGA